MSALAPGPGETLDVLSQTLRILQRRRGHRATTDDVLLAWAGATARPQARRVLDLGTGKGTVALLVAEALPDCRVVGLEAFAESHALAERNAELNNLSARYSPRLGDLRDSASLLAGEAPFDLVLGAPPFMPLGSGVLPKDPQRAAGRFELRGGVEAYAESAARHLAPSGVVVLLMDGHGRDRLVAALTAVGLPLRRLTAIHPRPHRPPTYWIGEAAAQAAPLVYDEVAMRPAEGDGWTERYAAIRRVMNLPS